MVQFTLPASWQESADVILKSVDGVEFRVHKLPLSFASPVFEGMFLIPQPPPVPSHSHTSATTRELPLIELSESGDVLSVVLVCVYPQVERIRTNSLRLLRDAITAAKKYDMEMVFYILRKDLLCPNLLLNDALAVYSTSCLLGLKEEAEVAAIETLKHPLSLLSRNKQSMGELLAVDFGRLVVLHLQRIDDVVRALGKLSDYNLCIRCKAVTQAWEDMARIEIQACPASTQIFSLSFIRKAMASIGDSNPCTCRATSHAIEHINVAQGRVNQLQMPKLI